MAYINKKDTQGTKPLLAEGELGYDKYVAGGDVGRVYVGTGSENIALAKKSEVDAKVDKVTSTDNAIVRFDGTTGAIQNSSVVVDDSGNINGVSSLSINGGDISIRKYTATPYNETPLVVGTQHIYGGVGKAGIYHVSYDNLEFGRMAGLSFKTSETDMPPTERMRIDPSGNVGIGVTPSAWGGAGTAIEMLGSGNISSTNSIMVLRANAYYNGTSNIYKSTDYASLYYQANGIHQWLTAPSGTAGSAITWNTPMTLDASGSLTVNKISLNNPDNHAYISLNGNVDRESTIYFNKSGTNKARIGVSSNSNDFVFDVNGAERMRIGANGNLLVGTTTDNGVDKLQVNGSISSVNPSGTTSGKILFNRIITGTGLNEFNNIANTSVYVEIQSTSGITLFPIYACNGNGVLFRYNYLNVSTGSFVNSNGVSFSFTETGSSPNTYTITVSSGNAIFGINATTKNSNYTVTLKTI